RVAALQRPLPEEAYLLVQPFAQPGDLVLGRSGDAQLLHQPIHPPGADAVDVGLLDDRDQGLLGPPARFQEAREVGALAQPGDRQLQLAHPRIPGARPVADAVGHSLGGALAELGADLRGDLGLHQLGGHPRRAVAQHIGVLISEQLVRQLGSGHPGPLGHRGAPFVALREQTDDSQTPRWPNSQSAVQPTGTVTPLSPTRPVPELRIAVLVRRRTVHGMESIVATEPTPKDQGRDRPSHPDPRARGKIGWIVAGSLATGLVAAVLLAGAPFIPAEEPAITGAVLCGFALGWAMLAVLSVRFTDQPQRWAGG